MKAFLACTGICVAIILSSSAHACNPTCGTVVSRPPVTSAGGNTRPGAPNNTPQAIPSGTNEPIGGSEVNWDLPTSEKARIAKAVRFRTETEVIPTSTTPAPATTVRPNGAVIPERVARAVAAQREMAQQLNRLIAKRAEIERWDASAQDKFRRAFGTTDEAARRNVMQRLDQQIQDGSRILADLSDSVRFEVYVSQNKQIKK
jgi:hypothetical protein